MGRRCFFKCFIMAGRLVNGSCLRVHPSQPHVYDLSPAPTWVLLMWSTRSAQGRPHPIHSHLYVPPPVGCACCLAAASRSLLLLRLLSAATVLVRCSLPFTRSFPCSSFPPSSPSTSSVFCLFFSLSFSACNSAFLAALAAFSSSCLCSFNCSFNSFFLSFLLFAFTFFLSVSVLSVPLAPSFPFSSLPSVPLLLSVSFPSSSGLFCACRVFSSPPTADPESPSGLSLILFLSSSLSSILDDGRLFAIFSPSLIVNEAYCAKTSTLIVWAITIGTKKTKKKGSTPDYSKIGCNGMVDSIPCEQTIRSLRTVCVPERRG
eukprot:comp22645_c0_seq1/m.34895 comp22645_c0_seq1/g.34895  ORF comp22645_c0_seq1/g.34895 comp22645_c0_seq1/m.34895 type:complete len:318 (+) comp22645_c0_seq1:1459-2412(+)